MEAEEYTRLARLESTLWWFDLLHRNLFAALEALDLLKPALKCADFGCGTGGLVAKLHARFPTWTVVGLDRTAAAVEFARREHGSHFLIGDVHAPPWMPGFFDVVFAIDVMYHRDVQPARMLQAVHELLVPGGVVVLNNPSYEWLRSYHDVFVHAARRYTAGVIAAELARAGFEIVRCTYWNTMLFPLMVLKRKLSSAKASHSDVEDLPPWLNRLFSLASLPEPALLRYGVYLPFGGSVLAIGRKRA